MGWFTGSSHSSHSSHHRPSYARSSSGSVFSRSHHGSSSYYKRRPRDGYVQRLLHKLKHLFREIYYYARRHPAKIFFMVIMPLISGGVLHNIARRFGISLPAILRGNVASGIRGESHEGYYGSTGYGGHENDRGLMGNLGNLGGLMKMAQAFM